MNYIWFAWITAIFYSASGLVGKFAANHKIKNPWLYSFVWSLIVVILSCGAAVYFGFGWPTHWGSIILAGAFSALTALMYTFAIYTLDVSLLSSLYSFRAPMGVLLGVIFFKESLSFYQLILIGILTIGGMVVSLDEKMSVRSFFRKPIAFALIMIALSAVYNALVKNAAALNSYWTTVFWYNLFNQIFLLSTIPFFWRELPKIKFHDYTHIILSAVLAGIGGLTIITAMTGNLGITMAILTLPLTLVAAMVLSHFAPHLLEFHTKKVYAIRLVAAIVMFAAALGLSK